MEVRKFDYRGETLLELPKQGVMIGDTRYNTDWLIHDSTLWFSVSSFCELIEKPPTFAANLLAVAKTPKYSPLLRIRVKSSPEAHVPQSFIHHSEIKYLKIRTTDFSEQKALCMQLAESLMQELIADGYPLNELAVSKKAYRGSLAGASYLPYKTPPQKKNTLLQEGSAHDFVEMCAELTHTLADIKEELVGKVIELQEDIEQIRFALGELSLPNKVSPVIGTVDEHLIHFKNNLKNMGFEIIISPIKGDENGKEES